MSERDGILNHQTGTRIANYGYKTVIGPHMLFDMKTWICATGALAAMSGVCPGADILYLNNGQKIAGLVTSYSDMIFHVQTAPGPELQEPLIAVRSVEFADSATPVSLDANPTGKRDA